MNETTKIIKSYSDLSAKEVKQLIKTAVNEAEKQQEELLEREGKMKEIKITKKELEKNIGFLRQWLNEDRITEPKKMVTNEEIEIMLGLRKEENEER